MNQLFVSNGISFLTSKDQVIFEKSEVVKDDGSPYVVYTPYSKKWKENFKKIKLVHYPSEEKLDKIDTALLPFFIIG
ncbi:MAG: deoxyribodipyrimidine photo-lyase [Flavobacterium sp.]|nr:deoxyribodipyrimidine photo-lyase [Flavobacterium sp.]